MKTTVRPGRVAAPWLLLCLALVARLAAAQSAASILGTIRDDSGAVLPGVAITLEDGKGATQRTAVSDQLGRYAFRSLVPGPYTLTASLSGFETASAEVAAGAQPVTQDFKLKITSFFDNVTVSAQKRDEEILDVPMAITALSSSALERLSATNLRDIQASVPGLSMVELGPGQRRAQIRGISSPLNLPTVGTYIDEASLTTDAAGGATEVRMLDMDRVEVLRGPQGTLYGAGSMGGTIKYVTKAPALDLPSFQFDSAAASVKDGSPLYRSSLVANLPIVRSKLGVRVAASTERSAGWVDYPAINHEDANQGLNQTLRVKGLWVATPRLTASVLFNLQSSDYDGQPFADASRRAPYALDQPLKETSKLTNVVLNYDAGAVSFLSSTGYLAQNNRGTYDFSSIYAPIYSLFGLPAGLVKTVAWTGKSDQTMFTQEFRVASKGKSPFSWTAGVFLRDYHAKGRQASITTPDPLPYPAYDRTGDSKSRQAAIFGEANYALTKTLTATVGLRYAGDKRETSGITTSFGPAKADTPHKGTFKSANPRAVLSFRPTDDTLIYTSAAKGFRSGGFNTLPRGCTLPENFGPETLWTYEVGTSASVAQGRLVIQGAVYRNSWNDMQTLTLCPGQAFALVANAGKATGTGADLQLTITPVRAIRLTLSGNRGKNEYDDVAQAHRKGDRIDYVPDYNFSVAADWSLQLGARLPAALHVDYQRTGDFSLNFRQMGLEPLKSDTVTSLNARFSVTVGKVELSLFGQNLTDENAVVQPAIVFGGTLVPLRPQPRTVGAGFGFRF